MKMDYYIDGDNDLSLFHHEVNLFQVIRIVRHNNSPLQNRNPLPTY